MIKRPDLLKSLSSCITKNPADRSLLANPLTALVELGGLVILDYGRSRGREMLASGPLMTMRSLTSQVLSYMIIA